MDLLLAWLKFPNRMLATKNSIRWSVTFASVIDYVCKSSKFNIHKASFCTETFRVDAIQKELLMFFPRYQKAHERRTSTCTLNTGCGNTLKRIWGHFGHPKYCTIATRLCLQNIPSTTGFIHWAPMMQFPKIIQKFKKYSKKVFKNKF